MGYLILVVVFIAIIIFVNKNTFYWETILRFLWKQVYQKADKMAFWINSAKEKNESSQGLIDDFEKEFVVYGNLINAIIDWINKDKDKNSEDYQEETFGYGRFDFTRVLYLARTNPEYFKKRVG